MTTTTTLPNGKAKSKYGNSYHVPGWWGNLEKMEALLRTRAHCSSDVEAFRVCGLTNSKGSTLPSISAVLAWGRGDWTPPGVSKAESDLAETFSLLWLEAREKGTGPKRRPAVPPMPAKKREAVQSLLSKIGKEWNVAALKPSADAGPPVAGERAAGDPDRPF